MRAIFTSLVLALCVVVTPTVAGVRVADAPAQVALTQRDAMPTAEPLRLAQKKDKKKKKKNGAPGWARKDSGRSDGARVSARSLNGVIKSQPRHRDSKITNVFIRRPARTSSGFMYEVWVRSRSGSETIVYVDPDTRQILYEAPGRR